MKNNPENGGHILVVDDNEMNRDMLSRRLAKTGPRGGSRRWTALRALGR